MTKVFYEIYYHSSEEDRIEVEKQLRKEINNFLFGDMKVTGFNVKRFISDENE